MRLLPLIFALALLVSCSDSKPEGIPADIVSSIESLRARTRGQNVADAESASGGTEVKNTGDVTDMTKGRRKRLQHSEVLAILTPDDTVRAHNRYEIRLDSMPPGGIKMKINPVGGYLGRVFSDSNKYHIASAEQLGVAPMYTLADAWRQSNRLEPLRTCEAYYLDNLTHSLPYLIPEAHQLLREIGLAFRDSLKSRGGGDYRIKVTSVLRTPALVRRLRRRNRNAVDTSAHLYGTTFDISYLKFICDSARTPRTQEDMKNLLAEVICDFRDQGRCYVKYERKQSCFHITTR